MEWLVVVAKTCGGGENHGSLVWKKLVGKVAGNGSGLSQQENNGLGGVELFLHCVVDKICGRTGLLETEFPVYFELQQNVRVSREEIASVLEELIKSLFLLNERKELSGEQVREHCFPELNGGTEPTTLMKELADVFVHVYKARFEQVSRYLAKTCTINKYLSLKDFNWSIQMVLGSDTLASQSTPLFKLELTIPHESEDFVVETLELDANELNLLISHFENVCNIMDQ